MAKSLKGFLTGGVDYGARSVRLPKRNRGGEMAEETIRSLLAVWASVRLKLHMIARTQKAAERRHYLLSAVNSIGMS